MREKNAIAGNYLSVPERFAQIYNVAVFHGKVMIQAEKLRELDTSERAVFQKWHKEMSDTEEVISSRISAARIQEGYRDIVKVYKDQAILLICGIENQLCKYLHNWFYV